MRFCPPQVNRSFASLLQRSCSRWCTYNLPLDRNRPVQFSTVIALQIHFSPPSALPPHSEHCKTLNRVKRASRFFPAVVKDIHRECRLLFRYDGEAVHSFFSPSGGELKRLFFSATSYHLSSSLFAASPQANHLRTSFTVITTRTLLRHHALPSAMRWTHTEKKCCRAKDREDNFTDISITQGLEEAGSSFCKWQQSKMLGARL